MKKKYEYILHFSQGVFPIHYPDFKTMKAQLFPGEELHKINHGCYRIVVPNARIESIGIAIRVQVK